MRQADFWELMTLKNRLVCDCYNIYTDDIRKALENGSETFEDLQQSMKLGVLCSACIDDSKKVIEQINKELDRYSFKC